MFCCCGKDKLLSINAGQMQIMVFPGIGSIIVSVLEHLVDPASCGENKCKLTV